MKCLVQYLQMAESSGLGASGDMPKDLAFEGGAIGV